MPEEVGGFEEHSCAIGCHACRLSKRQNAWRSHRAYHKRELALATASVLAASDAPNLWCCFRLRCILERLSYLLAASCYEVFRCVRIRGDQPNMAVPRDQICSLQT